MATLISPVDTNVLVPLDGSAAAEAVLPAAVTLGRRLPAAIMLLHVVERQAPTTVHGDTHLTDEAAAERYLTDVAGRIASEGTPVSWHVHEAPVGNVPLSIAAHAAEHGADLILLSAHGHGEPRSWLSGAVAQGVIRHAAPPVLLLRADHKPGEGGFAPAEVTVAIDAERQGEAAIPAALRLARALGVPLRLLMVVPTVETLPGDQSAAARFIPSGAAVALDLEADEAKSYLISLASRLSANAGGVSVIPEVSRGDPAQVIPHRVKTQGGILALATHGRVGLDALWSGSIGSRVIARGGGPFLLVHPEPASVTQL
jgi:nucleotide-binding universal stress UspA family protein